jgi:hypothetical protein
MTHRVTAAHRGPIWRPGADQEARVEQDQRVCSSRRREPARRSFRVWTWRSGSRRPWAAVMKSYRREDLGIGVRGKHAAEYQQGSNPVLLQPDIAAAFPTSAAENDALKGLLKVARTAKASRATTQKRSAR